MEHSYPSLVNCLHNLSLKVVMPHKKVGLVCEPDPASIAQAIEEFFQLGEQYFIPHLRSEKEKYSWHNLVEAIKELSQQSV